ncbi:hypothetical protein [Sphingosinicella sp. CPCC 101087]|uniref:hypothetical protein n=1 Tax=Sphingosinicella sp. CPCC 101087 TaxID=2497754 RepID=UPI0013E9BA6A|nr:hypothetical protein [Sphingosinicella sp. CPCC 101087]
MSETERLAFLARVPADLAALVVLEATQAAIPLRQLRSECRRQDLLRTRQRVAVRGRDHGFSWWQIARALNRDHATVMNAWRRGVAARG